MAHPFIQPALIVALIVVLLLLYGAWRRMKRAGALSGLPRGRVVYADSGEWRAGGVLVARAVGLSGKPDYILKQGRHTIPVEVKPGRRAAAPYDADILQLAAYCLLVQETTGARPPHGLLRYQERTFEIPYSPALEARLLDCLEAMRRDLVAPDVPRSHDDPRRCAVCGYREGCAARLVP
jgi:CRISPR-associated exonuclease Cas4